VSLLQVSGLDLYYGDAQALAGVGLHIDAGEIVAIVGANGAGKSSLIRAIHGIHRPSRGHIMFDGKDITGWPSYRVCEIGIGHVAEGRQVFPDRFSFGLRQRRLHRRNCIQQQIFLTWLAPVDCRLSDAGLRGDPFYAQSFWARLGE